jgi:hypothetical protein
VSYWHRCPDRQVMAAVAAVTVLLLVCVFTLADLSAAGQQNPSHAPILTPGAVVNVTQAGTSAAASALMLVLYTAGYICCVVAGVVAWVLRPQFRSGPLLVLAGWLGLVGALRASQHPVAFTLGWSWPTFTSPC